MILAVLLAQKLEPVYRHVGHVRKVVLYLSQLSLDARYQLVSLILIIFKYALHLYLEQAQDVVACYFAVE